MNKLFFPKVLDNNNASMEESPIIKDKNNSNNSNNSSILSKEYSKPQNLNLCEPFKAFSSALFMSEYQENDETVISSYSNSNSNKDKKNQKILDLNISPSLEKCLTNELLESMADDSSNIKLRKNVNNNNMDSTEQGGNNLKITKKLFIKEKENSNTLYEENINGFEYQLKFIENSLHNILPKSYKKFTNKNNYYNNKPNNHRASFPYSTNNKYKNNYYNNKPPYANIFYHNNNTKNNNNENTGNNSSNNNYVKNQILSRVQNMKNNENNYEDWICKNCGFLNRGFRKICANCNIYRKK